MEQRPRATLMLLSARVPLAVLLLVAPSACTGTRPFTDRAGRVIPGSVATMERIELGGMHQSVWFRGRDVRAPALILLHGGPGASEAPLFRHFDAALEDGFLVVYWEQRGAGRSYRSDIPRSSMTTERMLRDLDELVDTVRARYGKDRVALVGHSWGTILGTLYAEREPAKVSVYVGIAQVASFADGERTSLAWALRQAEARRDARALDALRALAPAPRSVDDELTLGRWVDRLGGMRQGGLSTGRLLWAALRTDEAGLMDLVRFGKGNRFSLEALRPQYAAIDLTRIRCFAVPVIFMLGRHDWHVPAELAARYYETIDAPHKRLVWFEHAGHDPPFEEPDVFVRAMQEYVRPFALGARPSPPPRSCPPNDVGHVPRPDAN